VLLGDGTGGFGAPTSYATGTKSYFVAVGDWNADGNPDLAVANFSSDDVSLLLGGGTGRFGATANVRVGSAPTSIAVSDFSGDGRPDLAVTNFGSDDVSLLASAPGGTCTAGIVATP
jgi:hypothetical protein